MKVELIDSMGSDLSVVNAARVSFDKESEWDKSNWSEIDENYIGSPQLIDKDKKLIHYLAKHDHWTPFAHTAIQLRMSAPIPIRTQCFKHKQGLVENEESRRYISSRPELFVPEYFRSRPEGSIKQGSGDKHPESDIWLANYKMAACNCITLYESMITVGICPEQARFVLPQGVEVNWIWTGNLYAFANFYNKRTEATVQKETQQLAQQVGSIISPLFPVSWLALTEKE